MGYIKHHAIVVTSWDEKAIAEAAEEARRLGCAVVGPCEEQINGYASFLVAPDGSKEGWEDSDQGDDRRRALRTFLRNSSRLEWLEVEYGNDDNAANVTESRWPRTDEDDE